MPDLYDLEALVRATRPVPDPEWAARLDTRVVRRFPDAAPHWYRRPVGLLRTNLVPAGALAGLALVVVVLIAVAHPRGDASNGSESGSAGGSVATRANDSSGSAASKAAAPSPEAPVQSLANAGPPRAVRQDAQLTLATPVDNVNAVSDGAIRVADRLGGYVQSSTVTSTDHRASASLELKVPAAQLSDALAQLSRLAHVKARSQAAEDLTDQRSALRAAVRDARADRDGLRKRLAAAATEKERASLRAALQRAEQRIVRRQRDVAALDREVAYATIDLTVTGTHEHAAGAAHSTGWTPGDALHDAGRVLEVSLGVALVVLAVCVPLGLLGGAAALAGRLVVRRRRDHALDMA
jgi:Domain of unknown function (DUF4349)